MQASLSELKYKATLNQKGWKELANGNSIPVNGPLFDFWYGKSKTNIQYQVKSNAFSELKGTYLIFTPHNPSFKDALSNTNYTVTMDGQTYNIAYLDIDDSINGMDQICLKLVSKSS
ncbi:hypothetical protein JCM15457_2536 [Liquorilactobacillus sucicola DSM 21376 = JCM 15457]|uniref:Phage head-tail adaptor n=1 Tax=Liquorilactobacillus sucicola DSM 21376 = JCM 15457 TaxID=1423806 RepID=A0A023D0E0_9LACO|nr:hypothetical protein [Liquorilactobacillus sucicola]KRN07428.1 hypothetical protein FD15_GL002296 [Liquorilactobacillus sucicola DSM 21376 = JCM 15457]GAJ27534.1 hypothetical protein JCM15457_2536 [Liquorilactobacillus sucicola DSM 21376 = JCM 15457]